MLATHGFLNFGLMLVALIIGDDLILACLEVRVFLLLLSNYPKLNNAIYQQRYYRSPFHHDEDSLCQRIEQRKIRQALRNVNGKTRSENVEP